MKSENNRIPFYKNSGDLLLVACENAYKRENDMQYNHLKGRDQFCWEIKRRVQMDCFKENWKKK